MAGDLSTMAASRGRPRRAGFLKWALLGLLALAILALLPITASPGAHGQEATEEIGPQAVWYPLETEERHRRISECIEPGRTDCAVGVMGELGASAEAIDFFEETGGIWFLAHFQEVGLVDLGGVYDPWRANSNADFALLNGGPRIVIVENELWPDLIDLTPDANYEVLVRSYPDLLAWGPDNLFETVTPSPEGGQRFIFQVYLNDGCHACGTDYMARVALGTAPDGTYVGNTFLDICWMGSGFAAPVAPGVPDCPPATDSRGESFPTPALPATGSAHRNESSAAWPVAALLVAGVIALGCAAWWATRRVS